jgi:hypothetical protein
VTCFILLLLFQKVFGVHPISDSNDQLNSALYLQVSIISQALIFVTRSRSWSYVERPGLLLLFAFFAAQMVSLTISTTKMPIYSFEKKNCFSKLKTCDVKLILIFFFDIVILNFVKKKKINLKLCLNY